MQLSAVVLTKNEEKNIEQCLSSLAFCNEIIVIDDYSNDATVTIAKKSGAVVYKHKLESNFASQRNFGLSKANGKWVLFVDSDERVTRELATEIVQMVNDPILAYDGFYIKRLDTMWGKELRHGEAGNMTLLRLGKKEVGSWKRSVHEVWEIKGQTYTLKHPLLHIPHQTLREFIIDVERMSSLHAMANKEEGKKSNLFKILLWPPFKFVYNYILKGGFLDGIQGFMVSSIMSFHSFLAWSKLWLLQNQPSQKQV